MGTWRRVTRLAAVTGMAVAVASCLPAPDPDYRLVRLPTPGGEAQRSWALAVNDAGQIVGQADDSVVVWTDGQSTTLADFGGALLNERGDVVVAHPVPTIWRDGTPTTITTPTPAFPTTLDDRGRVLLSPGPASGQPFYIWDDGRLDELEGLGDLEGSVTVADMNDRGQVVGEVRPCRLCWPTYAFVWEDGRITDLGSLGGGRTVARAINDRGQVAGESDLPGGQRHAYLWEDGRMTDVGSFTGTGGSDFEALSDAGHVVGTSVTAGGETHAYRWHRGTMVDLGTLGGGFSRPADVNDRGVVVGWSTATRTGTDPSHAFIWRRGSIRSLEGLGGPLAFPEDINNRGEVVGAAFTPDEVSHAVLWTRDRRQP